MPQRVSHGVHSRYPLLTGTFSIFSREPRQSQRHPPLALPVILSLQRPSAGPLAPVSPVKRRVEAGVTRPLIPRRLAQSPPPKPTPRPANPKLRDPAEVNTGSDLGNR